MYTDKDDLCPWVSPKLGFSFGRSPTVAVKGDNRNDYNATDLNFKSDLSIRPYSLWLLYLKYLLALDLILMLHCCVMNTNIPNSSVWLNNEENLIKKKGNFHRVSNNQCKCQAVIFIHQLVVKEWLYH